MCVCVCVCVCVQCGQKVQLLHNKPVFASRNQ